MVAREFPQFLQQLRQQVAVMVLLVITYLAKMAEPVVQAAEPVEIPRQVAQVERQQLHPFKAITAEITHLTLARAQAAAVAQVQSVEPVEQ
jgi:hypothetical protein